MVRGNDESRILPLDTVAPPLFHVKHVLHAIGSFAPGEKSGGFVPVAADDFGLSLVCLAPLAPILGGLSRPGALHIVQDVGESKLSRLFFGKAVFQMAAPFSMFRVFM